ncbi:hypothetical protein GQ44DRAFT_646115 [Phaeosphaeriaceae sp. PMI808]|nr:hypothetical protein GQ44DRAFT_646115 [Phaeosphaeriaceae sp. PMI808]
MSILLALAAIPGMLGTQEAIRQGQQKERREEHRARRCNIVASCIKSSIHASEINGRPIVLRDGAIYVDTCTEAGTSSGHLYAGYYLPYPDSQYEGLVTTITDEAPILNWVYIDARNCQLRYGTRKDAQPNFTGPFDCTRQDRRLTFQGWEGFCTAEIEPGVWGVFFDIEDDGLQGRVRAGTLPAGSRVLEIELQRVENKYKKDPQLRSIDQTINRGKKLDSNNKEVIMEPTGPTSIPQVSARRNTGEGIDENSKGIPKKITEPSSFPAVPWPGTTKEGASNLTAHVAGHPAFSQPSVRGSKSTQSQGQQHKRRDSVSQTSSSETPTSTPQEWTDGPHMRNQSPQSPTVVHVEPPVILSTHRLRPQRLGRSRPPQASQRYIDYDGDGEQQPNKADPPSIRDNASPIEFSEPNLVSLSSSFTSGTSFEKQVESRTKSILKRLGKGVNARRANDAPKFPLKYKSENVINNARNAGTEKTRGNDGAPERGRSRHGTSRTTTKQQDVAKMPRDSHQEDRNINPAISRIRRSLSVVRSPSVWGTGNEQRSEGKSRFLSW